MTTISLRAYYSEIEGMIERGRIKDAIIHCRQILKSYPKSIDTYRLLGKAYLEAQRFTEGADVLQRVLSAVPDDFVSQIGLSIIREDEGNLDAALWHMERAFEAQPSNKAVQDELRRLYGRRDGVQPTKIRLTRGALVRMYARGDLYQQAIAEGRMALVEQPDRVDIELILARMYYASNQKISATEICSRLLAKLPFCYEANRILAEILPGTAREDEVEIYKRRLFDLDPYLEFAPPGAISSAEAPEESIMIEPLELDEAKLAAEHPELAGEEEERLPEWLAALETREAPSDELTQLMDKGLKVTGIAETMGKTTKPGEPALNEEDQIPTWMKEAGWQPGGEDEGAAENIPEEVAEEIANEAEIPEWLQSIAPTEETPGIFGTVESAENEEDTAWLESILEGEVSGKQVLDEFEPETAIEEEPEPETPQEPEMGVITPQDVHPLEGLAEEMAAMETEPEPVDLENVADLLSAEGVKENIPDWLAGMAAMESEPEAEEIHEEIPTDTEWLKSLSPEEGITGEAESVGEEEVHPFEIESELPVEGIAGTEEFEVESDWSKRLSFEGETPAEGVPAVEGEAPPFEVEPQQPEAIEKEGIEEIEIDTDWLKRLPADEATIPEVEQVSENELPPGEIKAELPEVEVEGADEFKITTDWLKSLPEDKEEEVSVEVEAPGEAEIEPAELEAEEKVEVEAFPEDVDFLKRLAAEADVIEEVEPAEMGEIPFDVETALPEEGEEAVAALAADTDLLSRLSSEAEPTAEIEVEGVETGAGEEEPALESAEMPAEEAFAIPLEEPEVSETASEAMPMEPLTTEDFLSEIEKSIPPEQGATQPTQVSPPQVGGIPLEEFIASLEEQEEPQAEPQELMEEISGIEEEEMPGEIELTVAELEEILPEVVTVNNFDQTAGAEIPDWLKESLDIEAEEPQVEGEEEAPSLAGIPGIFPEKTPEELALEEILAATDEEPAALEVPEEVQEWAETEEMEEAAAVSEIEGFEEPQEELVEVTPPVELEETEEETAKLEAEERRALLGWLAEDFAETEPELEEEAPFELPEKEETAWVQEETIGEAEEIAEPVEAEAAPEETAEEVEPEEVPDWLMAMAEEKEPQPEAAEPKEEAIPEWLKDLEEEIEVEVQPAEQPAQIQPQETVEEEAQTVAEVAFEAEETAAQPTVEETSPVRVSEPPVKTTPIASEGSDLYNAQAALSAHDLETALVHYNRLIEHGEDLEDIIHDLRDALYHYPVDISIWQALGDAYMRSNQLQNALDAYTKAEELMR